MTTIHVLAYDGYQTSAERLLEGCLFHVTIDETDNSLTIRDITLPDAPRGVRWETFVDEVRETVQEAIDDQRLAARDKTWAEELNDYHEETGAPGINLLLEV